jgi:hypothetical protein
MIILVLQSVICKVLDLYLVFDGSWTLYRVLGEKGLCKRNEGITEGRMGGKRVPEKNMCKIIEDMQLNRRK